MDEQSSIHDSKLIKDDKVITNYDYICSLQNLQNNNNIAFIPIDSILYIQIPMSFCKKFHIPLHRNVDLSSQIDKYFCIECLLVQVYMIPNLDYCYHWTLPSISKSTFETDNPNIMSKTKLFKSNKDFSLQVLNQKVFW